MHTSHEPLMTPLMSGHDARKQLILSDVHFKWNRLSDADLSSINHRDDLLVLVIERYGLEMGYTVVEVDALLRGRDI